MLVVGFIGRLPSRTPKKQLLKVLFEAEPLENDFFKSNDVWLFAFFIFLAVFV